MAYATEAEVYEFYADADATDTEVAVVMRRAAGYVQQYAPVPSPVPSDYARLAADAELEVGRYLWNTDSGSVSSDSVPSGGGTSYVSDTYIRKVVMETMPTYFTAANPASIRRPKRQVAPWFINDPLELKGPYFY